MLKVLIYQKIMKFIHKIIFSVFVLVSVNLNAQSWNTYTTQNSNLPTNNITSIAIDSSGGKWFGSDSGIVHLSNELWSVYSLVDSSSANLGVANDLHIGYSLSGSTEIWVATEHGILIYNPKKGKLNFESHFTTKNSGLITNRVTTLYNDYYDVKWIGSDSGLSRFDGDVWLEFTDENHLSNNNIKHIDGHRNGRIYAATQGGGVSRLIDSGVDAITSASPYSTDWSDILSDSVNAVLVNNDGTQWFGSNGGLNHHSSTQANIDWLAYTESEGLINNFVQSIARDSSKVLWIGTKKGVSTLDTLENWNSFTIENGLSGNDIRDIEVDMDGSIWFATENGITHYKPSATIIDNEEYLPEHNFGINSNYPNPFNPETVISYFLNEPQLITVEVYNLNGALLKKIVNKKHDRGNYTVVWDGTDSKNRTVSSGIYISVLKGAHGQISTKKMLLIK